MPKIKHEKAELEGVLAVAKAMAVAARTAPKTRGVDAIETLIVFGEDLDALAGAMEEHGAKTVLSDAFKRDADNVRKSQAALLIGLRDLRPKKVEKPLDCGACAHGDCKGFLKAEKKEGKDFPGPVCLFQAIDPDTEVGLRDRAMIALMVVCGLREGEVQRLTWGDLSTKDAEGGPTEILRVRGKGGKVRYVALPEQVLNEPGGLVQFGDGRAALRLLAEHADAHGGMLQIGRHLDVRHGGEADVRVAEIALDDLADLALEQRVDFVETNRRHRFCGFPARLHERELVIDQLDAALALDEINDLGEHLV